MAPPRKEPVGKVASVATTAAMVPLTREALEELENKRDAFVEAMNTLSYAAKTSARTGYEYFNILASASGQSSALPSLSSGAGAANPSTAAIPYPTLNGFTPVNFNAHVRSQSVAPEARGRPLAIAPSVATAAVLAPVGTNTAVEEVQAEENKEAPTEGGKKKRKRGAAAASNAVATPTTTTGAATKKDRKAAKEKDPNEPKKPISAYFQFAAAARPIIKKDMGGDITGKEVGAEVSSRWHALPADEKKIWLAQHHKQMVKWYQEVNAYRTSKGAPLEPIPEQYRPGAKLPSLSPEDAHDAPSAPPAEGDDNEDEAPEEQEEEEEEEAPATPPPPAKKPRNATKNSKVNGTPVTKRGKGPGRPPASAAVAATPTSAAAADATTTPDSTKRRRAPTMKAKEAREAVKEKSSRSKASANANAELAAEKQVLQEQQQEGAGGDEVEGGSGGEDDAAHSITVGGGGKGGEKEKEKEKAAVPETPVAEKKGGRRRKGKADD